MDVVLLLLKLFLCEKTLSSHSSREHNYFEKIRTKLTEIPCATRGHDFAAIPFARSRFESPGLLFLQCNFLETALIFPSSIFAVLARYQSHTRLIRVPVTSASEFV